MREEEFMNKTWWVLLKSFSLILWNILMVANFLYRTVKIMLAFLSQKLASKIMPKNTTFLIGL